MPPELYGPAGLLVFLVIAVGALARDHARSDTDVRSQRDVAIAGWRDQTTATNRLAEAIEADQRDRATRRRQADRT